METEDIIAENVVADAGKWDICLHECSLPVVLRKSQP
jgi:hypothetical protein